MFLRKNGFVFFEKKGRKDVLLWAPQDSTRVTDFYKQHDSLVMSDKVNPVFAVDTGDTYYIIAGSFNNNENAQLMAGKYRNSGYKTSIISATNRNGKKTEYVSVKAFSNHKEAEEYLKKFKEKSDPAAWIYTKK
jgi:hypothetical protein